MTFTFWNDWNLGEKDCISHLSVFIIGCAYIQGFEIARKLLLIWIWKRLEDPGVAQARVDFFFMLIVVIPELGFYIYGNCTFYAPDDSYCRTTEPFKSLWRCSLIVLIYGYFYMLYIVGVLLFFTGVLVLYRLWSTDSAQVNQDNIDAAI